MVMKRAFGLAGAVLCLCALVSQAEAKGGVSYLVGATLLGSEIAEPVRFRLSVADQNSEILPVHVPANGLVAPPGELAALETRALPYELRLHYDFERYGGEQDWVARYDGEKLLYFSRGLGLGGAGWYEASPYLAKRLSSEVRWALAPPELRRFKPGGFWSEYQTPLIVLGLLFTAYVAAGIRGTRPASAAPALIEQRLRIRDETGWGYRA